MGKTYHGGGFLPSDSCTQLFQMRRHVTEKGLHSPREGLFQELAEDFYSLQIERRRQCCDTLQAQYCTGHITLLSMYGALSLFAPQVLMGSIRRFFRFLSPLYRTYRYPTAET
jgi:hypothetical protein